VGYGAVSFISSLYWLSHYHHSFWAVGKSEYACTLDIPASPIIIHSYTMKGLAELIDVFMFILIWISTLLFWVLSCFNYVELVWWFIQWTGWITYVDLIRLIVTSIIKVVGMF
jgi:hypothetical protein